MDTDNLDKGQPLDGDHVTRTRSLVFVHGINNSYKERQLLVRTITDKLKAFGKLDLFKSKQGLPLIFSADWRSLGNFADDLEDLHRHEVRREEATSDVADGIKDALSATIHEGQGDEKPPIMIILGHSMGQVLSWRALTSVQAAYQAFLKPDMPRLGYITMGGPMGNVNRVYRSYLQRLTGGKAEKPLGVRHWWDVRNPEDPVPVDLLLGYNKPSGVDKALIFTHPGHPTLSNPFAEHSSYFDNAFCYDALSDLIEVLEKE